MVLARAAFTDGTLDDPKTLIEFGEMDGTVWFMKVVVKAPDG